MNIDKLLTSIPSASADKRAGMRQNAENLRTNGTAEQRDAAERLLAELDAAEARESAARRALFARDGIGPAILEAFRADKMTETEERLIRVLLDHPGSTSEGLSQKMGWGAQSWHLHFGTMCFNRFAAFVGPPPEGEDKAFYSYALASYDHADGGWTMLPDAVQAFAALGLVRKGAQ